MESTEAAAVALVRELQSKICSLKAKAEALLSIDPKATHTCETLVTEIAGLYQELTAQKVHFAQIVETNIFFAQNYGDRGAVKPTTAEKKNGKTSSAPLAGAAGAAAASPLAVPVARPVGLRNVLVGFRSIYAQLQTAWAAAVKSSLTGQPQKTVDAHSLIKFEGFAPGSRLSTPRSTPAGGASAMAGGTSTSGNGSQRNSSTTGAADNGGRHVSLHAVQFKFGKLFSVLVAFRSNRFLEQAAAASDAENVTSSQRLLLPSVLALCIGTEEEHRAVTASSAGGARRFCVESRFEVFKKMSVEAEKALGHWRTVFIGSGVQLAEQAVSVLWHCLLFPVYRV